MTLFLSSPLKKRLLNAQSTQDAPRGIYDSLATLRDEVISLLGPFQESLGFLEHFLQSLQEIIGFLEEAGGQTVRARTYFQSEKIPGEYKKDIENFSALFAKALVKLDTFIDGAGRAGTNLFKGDNWTTVFDRKGEHRLLTPGVRLTSAALGFREPNFSTLMGIQSSRIDVMNALDMCNALRNILLADIFTIETRMDFAHETLKSAELSMTAFAGNVAADKRMAYGKVMEKKLPFRLSDDALDDIFQHFTSTHLKDV